MTIEEALFVLDGVLGQVMLNDVQELVFRHAWEAWTYEQIADQFGYTTEYVRNVGSQLWTELSQQLGVRVSKKNVQSAVRRWAQQHSCRLISPQPILPRHTRQDFGEAPDLANFAGRLAELNMLEQWIVRDGCRFVALLGMGGMGKTSLAVKLAHQVASQFEVVVWRSLRHAPTVEQLLASLIQFLSNGAETEAMLPRDRSGRLHCLMEHLRRQRCLIILDNAESVLPCQVGQLQSAPANDENGYIELLEWLADLAHEGCVLLTSREKPDVIAWKEGTTLPVRSLQLHGLSTLEAQSLFAEKGAFVGSEPTWETLIQHYAGNPLALKMVAAAIQDLFNYNIPEFLSVLGTLAFDDIRDLIERQFNRLSAVEKEVMFWLAINRDITSFTELRDDVICPISRQKLPSVLRSLKHRFLIETTPDGFTQQPVVMEYVTQRLIEQVSRELGNLAPHPDAPLPLYPAVPLLHTHALLKATAKDYIRDSQARLILQPLAERLLGILRSPIAIEQRCRAVLADLQADPQPIPGYAAGNMINLLQHLQANLTGLDLAHLPIQQAYFQGTAWQGVNLSHAQLGRSVFLEALGAVWSVAFSADGCLLAASDSTGEIHIWRVSDLQKVMTCQGHTHWVCAIAFSPDGRILASGSSSNVVKLWDVATGRCLQILHGHTEWVIAVAFNSDGTLLASSSADRTIKLWHPTTGECLQTLAAHKDWVGAIAFSPDGKRLASGSDDFTLKLWDVATATCLHTFAEHSSHVRSVAFSSDGQQLASGSSDRTVKLWDVATQQCTHTLIGHSKPVRSVADVADETGDRPQANLITASEDGTLRVWERTAGKCLNVLIGHTAHVRSLAVHPNGDLVASGSADQTVKLWHLPTSQCLRSLQGYTNFVHAVACGPANLTVASPTTLIASGHSDRTVRIWNPTTGKCLQTLKGHTNDVWSVAFSADGQHLASSSIDQTIRLWNITTGRCQQMLTGHTDWIHAIAFSADGQWLVSASSDQTIRLWDVATGKCLYILRGHNSHIWSVAFSPSNLFASSSDDHTIKLWEGATGDCRRTLTGHTKRVQAIAFSPDGAWLASSSSDQTIALWDVNTGRCLRTFCNQADHVRAIAFSPSQAPYVQQTGQFLLCSYAENIVKVWNAHTGECLHQLAGHTSRIWSVAFNTDGTAIVSGGEDGTLRLWDATSGECLAIYQNPRPYEGMQIAGIIGLSDAQKATLVSLGAME